MTHSRAETAYDLVGYYISWLIRPAHGFSAHLIYNNKNGI